MILSSNILSPDRKIDTKAIAPSQWKEFFSTSSLLMSSKIEERGLGTAKRVASSRREELDQRDCFRDARVPIETSECHGKRTRTGRSRLRENSMVVVEFEREHRDKVPSSSRRCAYRVYTRVLLNEKDVADDSNCTVFEDAAAGS